MNRKCELKNEYNKEFGCKVTTLKLCDKLMKSYRYGGSLQNIKECPFCHKKLI